MAHGGEDWEKARDWLRQESVTPMSAKVKKQLVYCIRIILTYFSGAKSQ